MTDGYQHTNRKGETYYLHEGRTKTGKPRYFFARTPRDGVIGKVPDGFEVVESINGVVSIRRTRPNANPIPAEDLDTILAELARHPHLRFHTARGADGEIVIYEPTRSPAVLFADLIGPAVFAARRDEATLRFMAQTDYQPVMKLVRDGTSYTVHRMTYRGRGGWSWPLATGEVGVMAKRFLGAIGTDDFYELM